jgi:hypothetical protein
MLTSNLGCGPMSPEIIEAVFRHSHKYGQQLMLISSRNQIDVTTGYVFSTPQYMQYIEMMRRKYPRADVVICRDHCGPGFGETSKDDFESVKNTIRCDIENGFDLIHIDLCHAEDRLLPMRHSKKIRHIMILMEFARNINSDIMFEIGTDENIGVAETDVARIIEDIRACQQVADLEFYVVQTGSLVYELNNVGLLNQRNVTAMHEAIRDRGVKLKEHNADYLTTEQIGERRGIVDAVNIAPQLGVVQTSYVLSQALIYGVDTRPFVDKVTSSNNWKKWTDHADSRSLNAVIAGHYHFNGSAYQQMVLELSKTIDVRENIIREITKVIEHYLFSL